MCANRTSSCAHAAAPRFPGEISAKVAYASNLDARVRDAIVDAVLPHVTTNGSVRFAMMRDEALRPLWNAYAPLRKTPLTTPVARAEIGLSFVSR